MAVGKLKPRYFVTDAPVAIPEFDPNEVVSDREPNVIWIRARMDTDTAGKVSSELVKFDQASGSAELHAGANNTALLIHNIVRWEGPDFQLLDAADQPMFDPRGHPIYAPVTPENIRKLDHRDPHIELVLEEIAKRNRKRESPKKDEAITSTSTIDTGPGSGQSPSLQLVERGRPRDDQNRPLATGASRSFSQIVADGRPSRSDDLTQTT